MITLITGAPGSGKTLYTVDKLLRDLIGTTVDVTDDDGVIQKITRTVYSNIRGLLLDHDLIDADWLEKLPEHKITGAVIVYDEVQRVWPNRPAGSKKLPSVEYLETHRHDGVDLIILTQNPQLLDPAVRALVGRHLHMRRVGSFGAAMVYEWDSCSNSLNYKAAFTRSGYRYSRRAQKLYISSRAHTKQKRSLPMALWIAMFGLAGAGIAWPMLMNSITSMSDPVKASSSIDQPASSSSVDQFSTPGKTSLPTMRDRMISAAEYRAQWTPRDPGQLHTAPRYDQLTQPVAVPYPAICVATASDCRCYTDRATRLSFPDSKCRDFAGNGVFWDFIQAAQPGQPGQPGQAHHTGSIGADGGLLRPKSIEPLKQPGTPVISGPLGTPNDMDAEVLAWMRDRS